MQNAHSTKGKIIGRLCKREKGTGWWSSFLNKMTTGSSRDRAGRKLGKGGLGAEAEIGEGPWATTRLGLPLASGRSSLSSGSVVERLHYEAHSEHVGTSEADAPRSHLFPRVGDFKKGGVGDGNDEADDDNDDR